MTSLPTPTVTRRPRLPLIWVVPVVAAIVAVWLLAREWRNHGQEIAIDFAEGSGIEAGTTKLLYKGVTVGVVKRVELQPDFSGVRVAIQLARSARGLACVGSKFWVVHPEIDFSGISGLEALVGGVHLRVRPGTGAPATHFRGLDRTPAPNNKNQGPAFLLRSDRLGNVHPGAPLFYRDIKVGEVETSLLANDATAALIRVRLLAPYTNLVRTNSEFWNAGGLPIQISLFGGGHMQTSTLESLVTGAVAFATPDEPAEVAADGSQFELHASPEKDWLKWRPEIPVHVLEASPEKEPAPHDLPGLLGAKPDAPDKT